jgi:hypothetical protein
VTSRQFGACEKTVTLICRRAVAGRVSLTEKRKMSFWGCQTRFPLCNSGNIPRDLNMTEEEVLIDREVGNALSNRDIP